MTSKLSRNQIRYERSDINAMFKKIPVFFNQIQPVKIINISKKGIAICSNQALKTNNHLKITLHFVKGESFSLNGQVVHTFNEQNNCQYDEFVELFFEEGKSPIPLSFKYGIHFEQHYLQFMDYLIESGCRNGFEVQRRDELHMPRSDFQR